MQKSFWYLLAWVWQKGKPSLATIKQSPGTMNLTTGTDPNTTEVPRIAPTHSFHTLGGYLSPPIGISAKTSQDSTPICR
jgi:hypothetical protein